MRPGQRLQVIVGIPVAVKDDHLRWAPLAPGTGRAGRVRSSLQAGRSADAERSLCSRTRLPGLADQSGAVRGHLQEASGSQSSGAPGRSNSWTRVSKGDSVRERAQQGHRVGGGEVDALAPRARGEQEDREASWLRVEAVDAGLALDAACGKRGLSEARAGCQPQLDAVTPVLHRCCAHVATQAACAGCRAGWGCRHIWRIKRQPTHAL